MGSDLWATVVQRGILLRERNGAREALLMRNPNGTWELPGGKIEHGDTAVESLGREIREETGLVVTDADPVETAVRRIKRKKSRGKFAVVYRCAFEGAGDDIRVSDEHVDFAWVDRDGVETTNLKQVDEYRSLRRVLGTEPQPGGPDGGGPATEGEGGDMES